MTDESSWKNQLKMDSSIDFDPVITENIVTSTPKAVDGKDRRSGRRSWFEKPSGMKYSIAVENNETRVKNDENSETEMETLLLTHFTNSPKIGFGTCKVGVRKHRTLIVKNPHDYVQNVKIERYPHKKNFFVGATEFAVAGESIYYLDISWNPETEGNFREMIQFSIDEAYRLQAFVFGTCQNPQRKKKGGTGTSILSRRVKKPFSLIYTQSLANIAKSYSPEKSVPSHNVAIQSRHEKEIQSESTQELSIKTEVVEENDSRQNTNIAPNQCYTKHDFPEKSGQQNSSTQERDNSEDKENQKITLKDSANTLQTSLIHDKNTEHHAQTEHLKTVTSVANVQKPVVSKECGLVKTKKISQNCSNFEGVHTKNYVSPNSYLRDLNETIENMSTNFDQNYSNSPETVLNESVPHDIMLCQLEYVKSNLEWNVTKKPSECSTHLHGIVTEFTGVQRAESIISHKFGNPFSVVPEGTSPRRTTFTVKRHQSHKTMKRSTPKALSGKSTVNQSINKPKRSGIQKGSSRKPIKQETGRNLSAGCFRKNYSNSQNSLNDHNKLMSALTPELTAREKHAYKLANVCFTPEMLAKSKDSLSVLPKEACVPEMQVLPTPERNLLDVNMKDTALKTPLSCHYDNFVLPTPEHILTRNGTSTSVEINTSKETLCHPCVPTVTDSPKHTLDSPLLSDATNVTASLVLQETSVESTSHDVVSVTITKEKPTVLSRSVKRKSFACLFSPPREKKTEQSNSLNNSESSFNCTPLPTSPNPDLSRRSTHIVENPKIIDCARVKRKRLFSSLDDGERDTKKNVSGFFSHDADMDRYDKSPYRQDQNQINEEPKNDNMPAELFTTCSKIKSIDIQNNMSDLSVDKNLSKPLKDRTLKQLDIKAIETDENTVSKMNESSVHSTGNFTPTGPRIQDEGEKIPCNGFTQLKSLPTAHANMERNNKHSVVAIKNVNTKPSRLDKSRKGQASQKHKAEPGRNHQCKGPANKQTSKTQATGVAKSKLILLKKSKTALPKHPMPFASKNIYYDEKWMDKQERGFSQWINFILTPSEDMGNTTKLKVDAAKLCLSKTGPLKLAPTKEALSFKEYSACRKLNGLRRAACKMFQSTPVIAVVQKVEAEVESHRLMIRRDRKVHADLGLKQEVLDLLLSFNPLWLRIGLETVYGEIIGIHDNSDVVGLSHFIVTRVLWNPDIAAQYAHPSVPHLYKEGYSEAIAQHLLKKFLLLVYFLDYAKCQHLIKHDPCLFCKDSEYKSCKALMAEFSRLFLAGEGDINRHLGYLGYITNHSQTALDEFDYAVQNLSTDLRDGLRLIKVLDLLDEKTTSKRNLRVPAISRLQKIHNMDMAFAILADIGINMKTEAKKVTSRDIVDGHREKTLHVLWMIILRYQIGQLLSVDQLKDEISILERSLGVRNQLQALENLEKGLRQNSRHSLGDDIYTNDELVSLLLKWCRVVCLFYKVKVENFTVSFSDGRALCYLVHHYHPSMLPENLIHTRTTLTYQDEMETLDCSFSDSPAPVSDHNTVSANQDVYTDLLKNERENFKVLYQKVSELGGVPLMIKAADMCNTIPDEKVVLTYTSYLCARLLDIRQETRAARTIQLAWRKHFLCKSKEKFKVREEAAVKIQAFCRQFLRRKHAKKQESSAIIIQKYARGFLARKKIRQLQEEKQLRAAKFIMDCMLAHMERKRFMRMRACAVKIQSFFRMFLVKKQLAKEKNAVIKIQNWFLSWKQSKTIRQEYLSVKQCVITIQRGVRKFLQKRKLRKEKSAIVLQKSWRGFCARKQFVKLHTSAVIIQRALRAWTQRREFVRKREAVKILQKRFKSFQVARQCRDTFLQIRSSCIVIQKAWRRYIANCNQAAVVVQCHWKGFMAQKKYNILRKRSITIQSAFRAFHVRKNYCQTKLAVLLVQRRYREILEGRQLRKQFILQKSAAVTIQAAYRAYCNREQFLEKRNAVVMLQTALRKHIARKHFVLKRKSALIIQRKLRATLKMRQDLNQYRSVKQAIVKIQAVFRGQKERKAINAVKQKEIAAKLIQKTWRCYTFRKRYLKQKMSALTIQKAYRSWKQKLEMRLKNEAVIILQRRFRAFLCAKMSRSSFLKLRSACCIIQRAWRRRLAKRNHAAIKIQSYWRSHVAQKKYKVVRRHVLSLQAGIRRWISRKNFLLKKKSALTIQRWYRAHRRAKLQRNIFLMTKGAALTIQALYRGYIARKRFQNLKHSTMKIQALFRSVKRRREYVRKRMAAMTIQKRFRKHLSATQQRKHFLMLKLASITIQANYRAYVKRKQFKIVQNAVIRIQVAVKTYLERKRYQDIRNKICTIQRQWRGFLVMRNARVKFLILKGAAITVQAYYRKHRLQRKYQQMQASVIRLQSLVRSQLVRKHFLKFKLSACIIQRQFRKYLEMKQVHENFLIQKGAALTIQAYFRGYLVRKEYKQQLYSSLKLQTVIRRFLCQRRYAMLRSSVIKVQRLYRWKKMIARKRETELIQEGAAITIQAHFRRYLQEKDFQQKKHAVVMLQSSFRMRAERKVFLAKKNSTFRIQQWFRNELMRTRARQEYQRKRHSVLILQRIFRSYIAKKHVKEKKRAVIHIQAFVRAFIEKQRFQKLKKSTVFCQKHYRAKLQARLIHQQYYSLRKAVVTIQACFRGKQARKWMTVQQECAIRIQSWFKCRKQQQVYIKLKQTIIRCQKTYRNKILAQTDRKRYLYFRSSATTIQAVYRSHKTRCMYKKMMQAVVTIQSGCRGFLERKRRSTYCKAAIAIQRCYRAHRHCLAVKHQNEERLVYLSRFAQNVKLHMAATMIQRQYRKQVFMRRAAEQLQKIQLLQSWLRGRIYRQRFLKLKSSVLTIQKAALHWLKTKKEKEKQHAAVVLQAVWRGRQVRVKNKSKKVEAVRKRVEEAKRTATEDKKLGNRTESALDYLLKYKQLSQILEALVHLDVATRLSPACCERMVEVNAVSVIYTLISSCNRSQPHMEIIKLAVSILLNLAKYEKTLPYVYVEGTLDILLDLMQIYREKGIIFNRTCTLVGILGMDSPRRMAMLSQSRIKDRIQSLYNLSARKYKLHEDQQIRQAKLNASKVFNSTLPIRCNPHKHRKIRPAWVLHRDSLHNIDNPMQAIQFVMDNLHISPK